MSQVAIDSGVPGAFGIQNYATPDVQEKAVNLSYRLAAELHLIQNTNTLNYWIGMGFGDKDKIPQTLRAPYVNEWWPGMIGEQVRAHSVIAEMIERLLAERKVVGLIVHEDVTASSRAVVMYCKHKGIPTIHIPHANCFYTGEKWDIHTESISDYLFAAGEYARDWYTRWGYPVDRIKVTGAPQWDGMYETRPGREESRGVLGVETNDELLLVYASSWTQMTGMRGRFQQELEDSLIAALEAAKELGATLCIKMHPGEAGGQEQGYERALKEYDINGCIMRHYTEYVLSAADIVLAHGPSNFLCQAAIWGVPGAYFGTEDYDFPTPGPVKVIDSATEACKTAMGLTVGETWDVFGKLTNEVHPNGGAESRIAKEVVSICL